MAFTLSSQQLQQVLTFTRTSPALGGCTSICSITKGAFFSQLTAALHVITCSERITSRPIIATIYEQFFREANNSLFLQCPT